MCVSSCWVLRTWRWGMRPKRQSRPSASTCINTSSRLRSRLVAAILDSRDGMSIRVCVPWYLDLSQPAIVAKCKQSRCARARNPIRFIVKLRKREREEKWEKVACFFPGYALISLFFYTRRASYTVTVSSKYRKIARVTCVSLCTIVHSILAYWHCNNVTLVSRREKEQLCSTLSASLDQTVKFSTIRCHGFRRKRIPWFNVTIRKSSR